MFSGRSVMVKNWLRLQERSSAKTFAENFLFQKKLHSLFKPKSYHCNKALLNLYHTCCIEPY